MEDQFVPYELALKLKELEFNEVCLTYYNFDGKIERSDDWAFGVDMEHKRDRNQCLAPLWQQAFDWFRTEHNLHALNSPVLNQEWTIVIDNTLNAHQVYWDKKPNYEEARLECLKKLIELLEENKK